LGKLNNPNTVYTDEFVSILSKHAGISKTQGTIMCHAFCKSVEECISNNKSIYLKGFGNFCLKDVAKRTGRNPRTGEAVEIPKRKALRFIPGKSIRDSINKGDKNGNK